MIPLLLWNQTAGVWSPGFEFLPPAVMWNTELCLALNLVGFTSNETLHSLLSLEIVVSSLFLFNRCGFEEAYTLIQEPEDRQLHNISRVQICPDITILNFLHAHGQWSPFPQHICQKCVNCFNDMYIVYLQVFFADFVGCLIQ